MVLSVNWPPSKIADASHEMALKSSLLRGLCGWVQCRLLDNNNMEGPLPVELINIPTLTIVYVENLPFVIIGNFLFDTVLQLMS